MAKSGMGVPAFRKSSMRATGAARTGEYIYNAVAKGGGERDMTGWIIAAIVAAVVIYAIVTFSRLVRQRNLVRSPEFITTDFPTKDPGQLPGSFFMRTSTIRR
jgi:hypothetical protein